MSSLPRRMVAELFGTFGLVFFGCAVVVVNAYPGTNLGLMGVALVHAIVFSVMVTATMSISGGLCNPALTVGMLVTRRLDWKAAVGYIVAQLAGAVLAGVMIKFLFPGGVVRAVSYGVPVIANTVTLTQAITVEALLTFFLMSAVFGTAVSPTAPKVGGFGIGLTLFFCIMAAGPLTGPAVNPARAFGPALMAGVWTGHAAYWVGPIIGAVLAALLWDRFLLPPREEIVVVV